MFEISQLKEKTLVELQEIAKSIGAKKYSQLKKLDLVYLILDIQASVPSKITKNETTTADNKPRRKRIIKKVNAPKENVSSKPTQTKPEAKIVPEVKVQKNQPAKK